MKNSTKRIGKSALLIAIGWLGGLFTDYVKQVITGHLHRPIVSGTIETLSIVEGGAGRWDVTAKLRFANTGNSEASVHISKIELLLPEHSERPLHLVVDDAVRTPPLSETKHTVMAVLPLTSDLFRSADIPMLEHVEVEFRRVGLERSETTRRHYRETHQAVVFVPGIGGASALRGTIGDDGGKIPSEDSKVFLIVYEGKVYKNRVYPPHVKVEYGIKEGKIQLRFSAESRASPDSLSKLFEPVRIFAHPEIADLIVLPTQSKIGVSVEKRDPDRIEYKDYELEAGPERKQLLYIWQ